MEKIVLKNDEYLFDASAKTVRVTKYVDIFTPEYLLLITNVTDNIIIYNFGCDGFGGTFDVNNNNRLTLEYDTTAMSDSDDLQIVLYSGKSMLDSLPLLETIRQQTQLLAYIKDSNDAILKVLKKIYEPE